MTNWKFLKYPSRILIVGFILSGCLQSDYTKLVKSELAKGIRQDSILLGVRFGDTQNDYFGKCFDLNSKKLVTQGPSGIMVQYLFTDSVVHKEPTQMKLLFEPSFDEARKITDMEFEISYLGWAPWNEQLQSDMLEDKVMKLLLSWYGGNDFITIKLNDADTPVKLDGNRRIMVRIKDAQSVLVKVEDILHPKFKHSVQAKERK